MCTMSDIYNLFFQLLKNIDNGCVYYDTTNIIPGNLECKKKEELCDVLSSKYNEYKT